MPIIELERVGYDGSQTDIIHLDAATIEKIVRWLTYKGDARVFNYPDKSGNWCILDVDTMRADQGVTVPNYEQKELTEAMQ